MTLPDILAMTTSGKPGPGKKIALPSGAVWEGGPTAGTSLITLPDQDPILLADNGSGVSNSIVGPSGPFGALARVFGEVLGHVPSFFADRVAAQALDLIRGLPDADDRETETRIVKFSSKATLLNPGKRRNRSGSAGDDIEERWDNGDYGLGAPIHRAYGGIISRDEYRARAAGLVSGPGDSIGDGVPLRASDGEYVVRASAVSNTLPLLELINSGWVPSAQFLAGMLSGFGSPVNNSTSNPAQWRDMLGRGVIADTIGNVGDAAVGAGAWAGAALGSALAPMFRPGGLLAPKEGSGGSAAQLDSPTSDLSGSPMGASMRATPSGVLGIFGGPGVSSATGGPEIGSLAQALGSGIAGAATAAGSSLGAMLGKAIAPALGPGGPLAPDIGEQLGRLIGSQFGGALTASMSVRTEIGGQSGAAGSTGSGTSGGGGTSDGGGTGDSGGPQPSADGGGDTSVVGTAGPSAATGVGSPNPGSNTTARWEYLPGMSGDGNPVSGWAYLTPTDPQAGAGVAATDVPDGMTLSRYIVDNGPDSRMVQDAPGTNWLGALTGNAQPSTQDLVGNSHRYNPYEGNFADLLQLAAGQSGRDLGTLLSPLLGDQAPESLSQLAKMLVDPIGQAYNSADPNHDWTNTLGSWLSQATGIPWTPMGQSTSTSATQMTQQQQIGLSAFESGISGLQQHGLLGGLTGAISGAASTAGSAIGGAIGTAIAPFLGPAAALGPAVGSFLGAMAGSMISSQITRPIEWAGNAVKELVGTGFGLTDLADGPGGRTVRGDIYNFNGTDPKSASIATERVRRRRAVAQQRGGGMGR